MFPNLADVTIKPMPKSVSKTTILNGAKYNLREYSTQYTGESVFSITLLKLVTWKSYL